MHNAMLNTPDFASRNVAIMVRVLVTSRTRCNHDASTLFSHAELFIPAIDTHDRTCMLILTNVQWILLLVACIVIALVILKFNHVSQVLVRRTRLLEAFSCAQWRT